MKTYFELLKENEELRYKLKQYENQEIQAQQFKKKLKYQINKDGNQWVIRSFRMNGKEQRPSYVDDAVVQNIYKLITSYPSKEIDFEHFAVEVCKHFQLPFKTHKELFANRKYYHNYYNKPLKVLASLELIVYHKGKITKRGDKIEL